MNTSLPLGLLPEWAPQRLVQLCWPSQKEYWGNHLQQAQQTPCQIITEVSRYQVALMLHSPECVACDIKALLKAAGADIDNVILVAQENNDIWCRDYGPISVKTAQGSRLLDFVFTGWGGKFPAHEDNQATARLVQKGLYSKPKSFDLILEGGAIDCDGNGTLLTTTNCLLNPNRNAEWDKSDYETFFAKHFGVEKVLWLEQGWLRGDDTDSHVDMLARFAPNNRILFQGCDNPDDEHYQALQALKAELSACTNASGTPYELVELPFPEARFDDEGERLPASYANFLITNEQVLVPIYNNDTDALALEKIGKCFPGRPAVGINCEALIQQYGSLHCATMQIAL